MIAHLSEPVLRFWLINNGALQQLVDAELTYGLALAIEAKVFADINASSGI